MRKGRGRDRKTRRQERNDQGLTVTSRRELGPGRGHVELTASRWVRNLGLEGIVLLKKH